MERDRKDQTVYEPVKFFDNVFDFSAEWPVVLGNFGLKLLLTAS